MKTFNQEEKPQLEHELTAQWSGWMQLGSGFQWQTESVYRTIDLP